MKSKLFTTTILAACAFFSMTARSQNINLQLQNTYPLGTGTTGTARFAVGDFNNDRFPDVVTTVGVSGQPVSVSLNNGAGGFAASVPVSVSFTASAVAVGDFNNDGNLDLAIGSTNNTAGVVNIRLGNGAGSFSSGTDTAVMQAVSDIAAADFNGDGNTDLAMTNANGYATAPTNAVRVILGNGAGSFGSPVNYGVGAQPFEIETGDFNADGRPDIAALAFTTTSTVSILLNNGNSFASAPATSWSNTTASARIVAADFNRDCATDLAVTRSDSVAILLGNNTGNFSLTSIALTNSPASLAVADFNLDRKSDLAIGRLSAAGGNGFIILPGDGAGGFGAAASQNLSTISDNLAVLDANTDGKTDILLGLRNNTFAHYNNLANQFLRTENDFDGDLKSDLSVFRPSLGDWFLQRSTQGFAQVHWGIASDKIVPSDYDGDFKTDLAVWRENGYGDPNRSYFFILQSSNNTLRQEQFGRVGDQPTVIGDWDGDGKTDVAVYRNGASAGTQSFFFYRPSASAAVDFRTVYWGTSGDQPARGDFDGDGKTDAAVFRPSNSVWYVLKSSDGQPLYQSWGIPSDRLVPADYDADGKTDFAVFRPSNSVWYILNSATGAPSYNVWGLSTDTPVPADYNGDGKAEQAVYRASEQRWYIPRCAVAPFANTKFGASGDTPVPAVP